MSTVLMKKLLYVVQDLLGDFFGASKEQLFFSVFGVCLELWQTTYCFEFYKFHLFHLSNLQQMNKDKYKMVVLVCLEHMP